MFVIKYRNIFFGLSALFIAAALVVIAVFGIKAGIEFTGGTLVEVSYLETAPDRTQIEGKLEELSLGTFSLRESGDRGFVLRAAHLTDAQEPQVLAALSAPENPATLERLSSIGPTLGTELRNKAYVAIALVVVAIILFIAYIFRHVSQPVASWKYGLIATVALLHDIIIPAGLVALLGIEVDVLFVVALLTILGYSVNDTIVVFDRVRENLKTRAERKTKEDFELTVGKSLDQTYARSISTSMTVAFVLLALFFFGAEATQDFSLVLLAGVVAGTYSSIFLATPLLVALERFSASAKKSS